MATLSQHDQAVLNCLFNPSLPLEQAYNEELNQNIQDTEQDTPEVMKTKEMEMDAIREAEKGELNKALCILNEAIKIAPKRASLYNNRAQVYQFKKQFQEAFDDLTKAIELGDDNLKRTLCQAYCQRGLLHRKNDETDLAREDFAEAVKLGSVFAKNQLVEMNPYAALCNQMLRKVMDNLK